MFLLAYEGCIIYEVATSPNLFFSVPLLLISLVFFTASYIRRRYPAGRGWYDSSNIVAGAVLSLRAIASTSGWGHPLLFAIISYCGYAISAACLGMAVIQAVRYFSRPQHADQGSGRSPAGP